MIERVRRWLVCLRHLERKGHWPIAIWYDGDMVCERCQTRGKRVDSFRALLAPVSMGGLVRG